MMWQMNDDPWSSFIVKVTLAGDKESTYSIYLLYFAAHRGGCMRLNSDFMFCVSANRLCCTTALAAGLSICREWAGKQSTEKSEIFGIQTFGTSDVSCCVGLVWVAVVQSFLRFSVKYSAATGPPVGPECEHCGHRHQVAHRHTTRLRVHTQPLCLLVVDFFNLSAAGRTHLGWTHPRLQVCPKSVVCCGGEPFQIWDVQAYRGRAQHGDGGTSFLLFKQGISVLSNTSTQLWCFGSCRSWRMCLFTTLSTTWAAPCTVTLHPCCSSGTHNHFW